MKKLLGENPGYVVCPLCKGDGYALFKDSYVLACPLCNKKKIIDWVTHLRNRDGYPDYKEMFFNLKGE